MYPRNIANVQDLVAAIALIAIGSLGLIARLGLSYLDQLPSDLRHALPLVLIGAGMILWIAQYVSDNRSRRSRRADDSREADYVR